MTWSGLRRGSTFILRSLVARLLEKLKEKQIGRRFFLYRNKNLQHLRIPHVPTGV